MADDEDLGAGPHQGRDDLELELQRLRRALTKANGDARRRRAHALIWKDQLVALGVEPTQLPSGNTAGRNQRDG